LSVPVLVCLVLSQHQANSETNPAPAVFTGKVVAIIDGDSAKVLRATRATELVKECPVHVATAFLGHSERAAQKHYWQVTDEDFKKRAQNPTQQAHAGGGIGLQVPTGRGQQVPVFPGSASSCHLLQNQPVANGGPLAEVNEDPKIL